VLPKPRLQPRTSHSGSNLGLGLGLGGAVGSSGTRSLPAVNSPQPPLPSKRPCMLVRGCQRSPCCCWLLNSQIDLVLY
jgi:hypothetical protein